MALAVGQKAPDFTLPSKNDDGIAQVSLQDALGKGKVVLLFFPFAFTSVCQDELCTVSQGLDAYAGATVFGISIDSPFAQEAFAKANQITIPLLSDFNKEVIQAYDVAFGDLLGFQLVAKRSAFVVGQDSTILYSESSDDPKQLPDFSAIQSALQD